MSEALKCASQLVDMLSKYKAPSTQRGQLNGAIEELRRLAGVEAELKGVRDSYDRACKTVALMHAAAVGEMRGPTIGVVEDVEAVRAELQQAREERTALLVNEQNLREELAALKDSLGEPVAWHSPEETDSAQGLVWLRENGVVFLGYHFEQPFKEYRDNDGFYVGQQDAESYWARYEDAEPCNPDGWCQMLPPLPTAQAKPEQADHPEQDLVIGAPAWNALVPDREYLRFFDEARCGSSGAMGVLRGIRACIAAYEAATPKPAQPPQQERVPLKEEQIIQALNSAINCQGSTTTENITLVGRLEERIKYLQSDRDLEKKMRKDADERIAELESQLAAAAKDAERLRFALGDPDGKLNASQLTRRAHEVRQKADKWDDWHEAQNSIETQMPQGWRFVLDCSPGDWSLDLIDPEGNHVEFDHDCDSTAGMIRSAIDAAIARTKEQT